MQTQNVCFHYTTTIKPLKLNLSFLIKCNQKTMICTWRARLLVDRVKLNPIYWKQKYSIYASYWGQATQDQRWGGGSVSINGRWWQMVRNSGNARHTSKTKDHVSRAGCKTLEHPYPQNLQQLQKEQFLLYLFRNRAKLLVHILDVGWFSNRHIFGQLLLTN